MRYLSLFSGIGGFELGIKQAYEKLYNSGNNTRKPQTKGKLSSEGKDIISKNIKSSNNKLQSDALVSCIGYSEIDKYAIQTYKKHFNHKNYGDITKINEKELPDFDLLVGGFPCQAFSIAGKRGGFSDTRGTLFFEIARIIREKQPRLLLLENVKGLLSHDKGNTFTTIISTLDELGYDIQWQVLNSKNFGVPQNRERVFIIGHLRGTSRREVFPFGGQSNQNSTVGESAKTTVARAITGGGHSGGNHSGMTIIQENKPKHSNDRVYSEEGLSPTINTMQGGNRQPFIRNPYNGKTSDKETGTLGTSCGTSTGMTAQHLHKDSKIRRLTPVECMRLQGFPDSWCDVGADGKEISDTQKYKMAGNAVTVNVIQAIMEKLLT